MSIVELNVLKNAFQFSNFPSNAGSRISGKCIFASRKSMSLDVDGIEDRFPSRRTCILVSRDLYCSDATRSWTMSSSSMSSNLLWSDRNRFHPSWSRAWYDLKYAISYMFDCSYLSMRSLTVVNVPSNSLSRRFLMLLILAGVGMIRDVDRLEIFSKLIA